MTKLYVSGFPLSFDELQLAQLFGPYGDIKLLTIARDKFSGTSKGFGFVEMKTEDGAAAASANLDGTEIKGRRLEVKLAAPQKPKFRPKYDRH